MSDPDVNLKKRYDDMVKENADLMQSLAHKERVQVGRMVVVALGAAATGFAMGYVAGVLRLGRS